MYLLAQRVFFLAESREDASRSCMWMIFWLTITAIIFLKVIFLVAGENDRELIADTKKDGGESGLNPFGSAMRDGSSSKLSVVAEREPSLSEQLQSIDWFQFEKLLELLYRKQGYAVTRRGGANADGEIDLVLERDNEKVAVQCKHWKNWKVRVPKVREFIGAMTVARISKGRLITSSSYTGDAKDLAEGNGIQILDNADVLKLLESVDGARDREIQSLLTDKTKVCPKCERPMVLRTATRGRNIGKEFWGCSGYPKGCNYIARN